MLAKASASVRVAVVASDVRTIEFPFLSMPSKWTLHRSSELPVRSGAGQVWARPRRLGRADERQKRAPREIPPTLQERSQADNLRHTARGIGPGAELLLGLMPQQHPGQRAPGPLPGIAKRELVVEVAPVERF